MGPRLICAVIAKRNPLADDYIDNIKKFLPILRAREFNMQEAATYLEDWIHGTWKQHPLMPIDAYLDSTFGARMSCETSPS